MKTDESLVKIEESVLIQALTWPAKAQSLAVTNNEELVTANAFVKSAKALIKEIRDGYDDIIKYWNDGHKATIAKRDKYLKPVSESVEIAKGKMAPYMEEQQRKIREAEEKARQAERDAEEAERKAEEERQAKACQALHDGDTKAAEDILAEPVKEIVPETVDIPEAMKLEGTHTRVTWDWELENIESVPRCFLMPDRVKINKYVQEQKEKSEIPGIRVFQKTGISTRGG